jgi:tellurite resistance protein TerC
MDFSEILALVTILLQVTFLEGVLSLDNAAVLGAVVLSLPDNQKIPWPKALHGVGQALDPLLGSQRCAALRVGLLGAYLGRGLMLVLASFVIRNPWLQLIGAAYLLKISVAELGKGHSEEDGAEAEEGPGLLKRARERGFWATVLMVELMDLAFSLDNVVVVVSLSSKLWLVMVGVAIGILTMRFAAGLFTKLIQKIPSLSVAAYVLVFNIGVEFIVTRILGIEIHDFARFGINVGTLLLAVVYDKTPALQRALRLPFRFFGVIFHTLDWAFNTVLLPVNWIFGKLFGWIGVLFKKKVPMPQPVERI